MMLEALCRDSAQGIDLPLEEDSDGIFRTDWQPLLGMLADKSVAATDRAEQFHASMARAILAQARLARERHEFAQVGLCGGVFQNRVLAEQTIALLDAEGFDVYLPLLLPCNDAALSYGQAAEVAAREAE
jgi:hydrogenase maturation protein HypF